MCVAPRVIKKISTDRGVRGVTSVDDELFVLLRQDVDQVAVYSINDNDYKLLRHLSVPRLEPDSDNVWLREKEVQRVKAEKNIPFPQARQIVIQQQSTVLRSQTPQPNFFLL